MPTDVVADVRRFNRRWTQILGLLDAGLLDTEHPLPEARVLYELAQRPVVERIELRVAMGIDDSFLSRLLQRLTRQGLISTATSPSDGRRRTIALTVEGREAAAVLDRRSAAQIATLLGPLDRREQRRLTAAMAEIERLTGAPGPAGPVLLRELRPGDLGWVVERHGELYAEEYGWDADFESLVGRIVADFHDDLDAGGERAWIAEVGGTRAGCVFCKRRDADTAQLRLLLVEPQARGLGLGRRLVDAVIDFARHTGYRSIVLWTNDVLVAARHIYETTGFELVEEERHHSYGHDLLGQIWTRDL